MTRPIAIEARIRGRVQGVAFRAWTQAQADKLELAGWVTNNPDGSVSALFIGPKGRVEEMVAQLWDGPGAAVVEGVTTRAAEVPSDTAPGFRIIR